MRWNFGPSELISHDWVILLVNHEDDNFSSAHHRGCDGCRPWFLEHVSGCSVVVYEVSNDPPLKHPVHRISSSIALNALPSRIQDDIHILALVQSLVDTDSVCDYDAVILIEQRGVSSVSSSFCSV
jgi:hypothetical protein